MRLQKTDKWLEYLMHYADSKELLPCPDCGENDVEVIILKEGRGSTTFHCKHCKVFRHYDGKMNK